MNNLPFFFNRNLERLAQQFFGEEMSSTMPKVQRGALDKAFEIFTMGIILDKPFDEIKRNIWVEGNEDGGIDGVYIDIEQRELIVFQCKNTAKLKANDIEKFRDNYRQIFQEGKVKAHAKDLLTKLNSLEYKAFLGSSFYTPKLYFVFNGDAQNNDNQNVIQQINDNTIAYFDNIKLNDSIADMMITERRRVTKFVFKPENSNVSRGDAQGLISFVINNIKSTNFRISALHLCELLEEEQRTNGSTGTLFSDNIRGYLGRNNFTNKKIIETLESNQRYYFPFLNNGITMICSRLRLPENKQIGQYIIESENPVIINGLQTTNILYEQYKIAPEYLDEVFVLVRLYETDQQELIDLITDATNTQSAIDFRDKLSNKPFMKNLKAFFTENDFDLVTKRGDTFRSFIQNDKIRPSVENDLALQNWYKIFVENKPMQKKNIAVAFIYENITDKKSILFDFLDTDIFRKQVLFSTWFCLKLEQNIFLHPNFEATYDYDDDTTFSVRNKVFNIILKASFECNFDIQKINIKIQEMVQILENGGNATDSPKEVDYYTQIMLTLTKINSIVPRYKLEKLNTLNINTEKINFS